MRTDQRILEIRAGRRWPLVDEPVGLVVAGARPGSEVAVRATVEGAGAVHQARATFDADQAGVVDTAGRPAGPAATPGSTRSGCGGRASRSGRPGGRRRPR